MGRHVRVAWDALLEEWLIQDECPRCRRNFWRQQQKVVGTWKSPWVLGALNCPTCRQCLSSQEPEAEPQDPQVAAYSSVMDMQGMVDHKGMQHPKLAMADNMQNMQQRTRCRAWNTHTLVIAC